MVRAMPDPTTDALASLGAKGLRTIAGITGVIALGIVVKMDVWWHVAVAAAAGALAVAQYTAAAHLERQVRNPVIPIVAAGTVVAAIPIALAGGLPAVSVVMVGAVVLATLAWSRMPAQPIV
jgi:hypothetical protein